MRTAAHDQPARLVAAEPVLRSVVPQHAEKQAYAPDEQTQGPTPDSYRELCEPAINATLSMTGHPDEPRHFPFCDEDMWAGIFANTGFSTQEGVFYG